LNRRDAKTSLGKKREMKRGNSTRFSLLKADGLQPLDQAGAHSGDFLETILEARMFFGG
jgi:hypothetical protein